MTNINTIQNAELLKYFLSFHIDNIIIMGYSVMYKKQQKGNMAR